MDIFVFISDLVW